MRRSMLRPNPGRQPEMTSFMLWFDNRPAPLAEKVRRAADYHAKKYGKRPNLCLVHPAMMAPLSALQTSPQMPAKTSGNLGGEGLDVDGITIRPFRGVLPNHLWLGVDEEPAYMADQKQLEQRVREKE